MESGKAQATLEVPKELDLASVLITEANEGLGLEFIRQLILLRKPPVQIFAAVLDDTICSDLDTLVESTKAFQTGKVVRVNMDVRTLDSVRKAVELVDNEVGKQGLTLLINNGGILDPVPFPYITQDTMREYFDVNTIAPVRVTQEFLPLLQRGTFRYPGGLSVSRSAVLNICDWEASITRTGEENGEIPAPSSKMSKAALNMAMRITAKLVEDQGILVVMMCPGIMEDGKKPADMTEKDSVETILKTLKKLNKGHQGSFMDSNGERIDF